MHTKLLQTIEALNDGHDLPRPKKNQKYFASSLGAWPVIEPPFSRQTAWRLLAFPCSRSTVRSHQVSGFTHFCKCDGHKWRSHGEARCYPPCWIVESEDFSDFTPRWRNCVCELDSNWWAGSKICSLLSAHHLIGAYFLTTKSDKMLLTRLYGS